jgi:hypothetical protein
MSATVDLNGKTLTIKLHMQTPTPSTSGKTLVVASTHGRITTTLRCHKEPIVVNANAFIYPGDRARPTASRKRNAGVAGKSK